MRKIQVLLLLLSFGFANAQYTAIPDPNFEQELINDGVDSDGVLNGRILTADAVGVQTLILTGTFKPNALKITNLTGIEAFTALRVLHCEGNLLNSINLSQNLNLQDLRCHMNNLTTLDLRYNTQLTLLYCNNNALTRLDVTNNINLLTLWCFNNVITTLNVTGLSGLTTLRCQSNNLHLNLNLSQNPSLTTFSATSNPNLLCIQVANVAAANSGSGIYTTWTKDATAVYSIDCEAQFPTTDIPDGRFEDALIALGYDNARDNRVLTANISGIASLNVSGRNISSLEGIQDFTALSTLTASNNSIVALDVTQNTNLQNLYCNNNALVTLNVAGLNNLRDLNCSVNNLNALNVTQNPDLEILNCSNNVSLGSINVTQNPNLEVLRCSNSGLTVLNVRFNLLLLELYANFNQITNIDTSYNAGLQIFQCINNDLTSLNVTANTLLTELFCSENRLEGMLNLSQNALLTNFNAVSNSSLYCIQVADENAATAGNGIYATWNKEGSATYSENCSDIITYLPDDAFEQYLIDQGLDDQLDNYVLTVNIETETTLDLSSLGVTDMTGIEDFAALEELYCSENSITNLDVSQNTNLQVLECGSNQLNELVLNTSLVSLICGDNTLASLDVSQLPGLITLICDNNDLTALDVSSNVNLTHLNASSNLISSFNVGANTGLSVLNMASNRLTTLDVTQNTGLTTLRLNNNLLLGGLDVSNQPLLTTFNVTSNAGLTCIQVADAAAASSGTGIYAGWLKDATASYSVFCVVSSEEFELLDKSIKVYPNPVSVTLFVSIPSDVTVKRFTVYNIQGRKVLQTNAIDAAGLNVTGLHDGVYFLAIETEKYTVPKKIIVSRR